MLVRLHHQLRKKFEIDVFNLQGSVERIVSETSFFPRQQLSIEIQGQASTLKGQKTSQGSRLASR